MKKHSVFGADGFIGSEFMWQTPESHAQSRIDYKPHSQDILYFISTVDNYNVKTRPFLDIETNLSLLIYVLEQCRDKYGKQFTFNFISSWFVYGVPEYLPVPEVHPCDPKGFYSITKRTAEQLLQSYCETYGIKYRILRLANVIGIGDEKISLKKNAVQCMIRELAQGRSVNLYATPSIRDIVNVKDIVRGISLVLEKGELNRVYNIGNGIPVDVNELILGVVNKCKAPGKINLVPVPEFHKQIQATKFWLDISDLQELGYEPLYSVDYTVRDLIDYYEKTKE